MDPFIFCSLNMGQAAYTRGRHLDVGHADTVGYHHSNATCSFHDCGQVDWTNASVECLLCGGHNTPTMHECDNREYAPICLLDAVMATASDQILDSKTVFPHSYRE
ncbi:Uncharacterized protein HZ326_7118 [Fusarium oxysporum f. sp. albedinis]|nr:Uncharacterized protein HZ326_7118 [Fusarium oxysporum f. sp. albedinis]